MVKGVGGEQWLPVHEKNTHSYIYIYIYVLTTIYGI